MRPLAAWLEEYAQGHQNPINIVIHKICVPIIFFTVVGFINLIPYSLGPIKVSEMIIFFAMVRYLAFGKRAFAIMFLYTTFCMAIIHNWKIKAGTDSTLISLLGLFVVAWIGQFVGHKIEGKKPSFFKDLQFLLIGPLWIFKRLLR